MDRMDLLERRVATLELLARTYDTPAASIYDLLDLKGEDRCLEGVLAAIAVMKAPVKFRKYEALAGTPKQCLVKGCENTSAQGEFVGDLCMPCHHAITTGIVGHGNGFIGVLRRDNEDLVRRWGAEVMQLKEQLAEAQGEIHDGYKAVVEMNTLMSEGSGAIAKLSAHPAVARLCMVLREKEATQETTAYLKKYLNEALASLQSELEQKEATQKEVAYLKDQLKTSNQQYLRTKERSDQLQRIGAAEMAQKENLVRIVQRLAPHTPDCMDMRPPAFHKSNPLTGSKCGCWKAEFMAEANKE